MNYKQGFQQLVTEQASFNTRNEASIRGLEGDVTGMQEKIKAFEDIVTDLTPEEQAAFDAIKNQGESTASRFEALDALTPPKPPAPTE